MIPVDTCKHKIWYPINIHSQKILRWLGTHVKYHGHMAWPFFMQLMFKHLCEAFTQLTDHSLCAHLQLSPGSFHTHTLQFLHTAHEIIEWEGGWEGCYRSPCCNPPAIDRDVTSSSGYLNHPNSLLYKV